MTIEDVATSTSTDFDVLPFVLDRLSEQETAHPIHTRKPHIERVRMLRSRALFLVPASFPIAVTDNRVITVELDEREQRKETLETLLLAIEANWNRLAFSGISEPSYQRLLRLAKKKAGWRGVGSQPLSTVSLRRFLEFWKLVRQTASEPEFALAPNGNLQVEWHKNRRRHLDIEFGEGFLVYYGLFDGSSVHEGAETVAQLVNMLVSRPSKPLRWRCA